MNEAPLVDAILHLSCELERVKDLIANIEKLQTSNQQMLTALKSVLDEKNLIDKEELEDAISIYSLLNQDLFEEKTQLPFPGRSII